MKCKRKTRLILVLLPNFVQQSRCWNEGREWVRGRKRRGSFCRVVVSGGIKTIEKSTRQKVYLLQAICIRNTCFNIFLPHSPTFAVQKREERKNSYYSSATCIRPLFSSSLSVSNLFSKKRFCSLFFIPPSSRSILFPILV